MKLSQFAGKPKPEKNDIHNEENLMDKYNELKDLPKDDLSKKLMEEVSKQKKDGTFDYQQLESTLNTLQGMIPSETFENMKRILETIR